MDSKTLKFFLSMGENISIEFKRCESGIRNDTYETVCSFLNRFDGDTKY